MSEWPAYPSRWTPEPRLPRADQSRETGLTRKARFRKRLRIIIIILVLGVVAYMLNPLRPVNAKAEIAPELMERGTVHTATVGTVHYSDEFFMSVTGVGILPWDLGAEIGIHSLTDDTVHGGGSMKLGDSVTVPTLGDFILIELVHEYGHQAIRVLFIPV